MPDIHHTETRVVEGGVVDTAAVEVATEDTDNGAEEVEAEVVVDVVVA